MLPWHILMAYDRHLKRSERIKKNRETDYMANQNTEYLTVQQVMSLLHISRPTIYKMIREGKIKAFNTGKKYLIWQGSLQAQKIPAQCRDSTKEFEKL